MRNLIKRTTPFWYFLTGLTLTLYLVLASGCGSARHVPKGQTLLKKNKFDVKASEKIKNKTDFDNNLYLLANPKPNDKALNLAKFRLSVYNRFYPFNKGPLGWIKKNIGQPPALVDSVAIGLSAKNMQNYLFNKGYFGAKVHFTTQPARRLFFIKLKRKTVVTYHINLPKPYSVDEIFYPEDSVSLAVKLLKNAKSGTYLKTGQQFDGTLLQKEIDRLNAVMRNNGFFDFGRQYLHFKLDSSFNHKVNLYLELKHPAKPHNKHIQYKIGKVKVYPYYTGSHAQKYQTDTIGSFIYLSENGKSSVKPSLLNDIILVKPKSIYSQRRHEYTIRHLLDLGTYQFVNVRYEPSATDSATLDCSILLTPVKKHALTTEFGAHNLQSNSATVASRSLGLSLTGSYRNPNTFKAAEQFSFSPYVAVEFNLAKDTLQLLNTLEINTPFTLSFPKLLFIKSKRSSPYFRPKTQIQAGYNYQRRLAYYTLNAYNFSYSYDFRENERKRHIISPISISFINYRNFTDAFLELLARNTYLAILTLDQNLLIGGSYSYLYNNQDLSRVKNFTFFKGNIDLSGNSIFALESLLKTMGTAKDGIKILGTDYSRYVKLEADIRRYIFTGGKRAIALRAYAGLGIPYCNTPDCNAWLPYIKSFSAGGTSDIRSFKLRSIGPGSLGLYYDGTNFGSDTVDISLFKVQDFERYGNLKMEANIEYRFHLFSYFDGAIFADAGNIWQLYYTDDLTKSGVFDFKRFYKEIAVGTGFGLRLDLSYFVFRIDLGVPILDPRQPEQGRWVFKNTNPLSSKWRRNNLTLNLGFGYPF